MACRIAPIASPSSCDPHAKAQPPPPIAQAPNPTRVIAISVVPSSRVGSVSVLIVLSLLRSDLASDAAEKLDRVDAQAAARLLHVSGTVEEPERSQLVDGLVVAIERMCR